MKHTSLRTALSLLAVWASGAFATVNFPFPQSGDYGGNGITLSDKATANAYLQEGMVYYMKTFFNSSGSYGGIRSNAGSSEYFSEGVGYGMLLTVYFSSATTSYQTQFDKLWNFYQASADANGLMNWKMGNLDPSTVWGKGAATDAEMDVAAALIMASYQFDDSKYRDAAAGLLAKVRAAEFETNGLHKPGDAWNDKKNPSYVSPAYYKLFREVDTDGADFWDLAYEANMALLETNSKENSTGLFDNWSNASGTGLDGYYGYDASRTPWRLAQDWYWFADSRTYTMLNKLGKWANGKTPSAVSGSISRSGGMGSDHNSTFVATLMASLVTTSDHQAKLDAYWKEAMALGDENYFNMSLKLLCGLAVSGNMPNYAGGSTPMLKTSTSPSWNMSLQGTNLVLTGLAEGPAQIDALGLDGRARSLYRGQTGGSLSLSLASLGAGVQVIRVSQNGKQQARTVVLR